jgi:uncharacterized membrane protein YbaN (DUF454 family)
VGTVLRDGIDLSGTGNEDFSAESHRAGTIEFDEQTGRMRVSDQRLFRRGCRSFCRQLLQAIVSRPGVRRASIDLGMSCCQVDFAPETASRNRMADVFSSAVAAVLAPGEKLYTRTPTRRLIGADWVGLTAFPGGVNASIWETRWIGPDRIQLQHLGLGRMRRERLAARMRELDGVDMCRFHAWWRRVTIVFQSPQATASGFIDAAEQALKDELAGEARSVPPAPQEVLRETERSRTVHLILAGGSFTMTLVGLVVPGVPTVPFLMATSYFLARSSPRLSGWLKRSPFFGPIVRELNEHHAISRRSKRKLFGLTFGILSVSLVVTSPSEIALIVILVVYGTTLIGVARLPAIQVQGVDQRNAAQAELALFAP